MKLLLFLTMLTLTFQVSAEELKEEEKNNPVCIIKTSMGDIMIELFSKEAPMTVSNFVMLAEGKKGFIDPSSGEEVMRPYYDGLIFHRVIKDFMIQGGCPLGTGMEGPGFVFPDEISASALGLDKIKAIGDDKRAHPHLMIRNDQQFHNTFIVPIIKKLNIQTKEEYQSRLQEIEEELMTLTLKDCYEKKGYQYKDDLNSHHLKRGVLAMANRGPNTNGAQFFINLKDTPWLDGKHTAFGKVIKGMDVIDKIALVPVGPRSKPVEDVKIISIRLQKSE